MNTWGWPHYILILWTVFYSAPVEATGQTCISTLVGPYMSALLSGRGCPGGWCNVWILHYPSWCQSSRTLVTQQRELNIPSALQFNIEQLCTSWKHALFFQNGRAQTELTEVNGLCRGSALLQIRPGGYRACAYVYNASFAKSHHDLHPDNGG